MRIYGGNMRLSDVRPTSSANVRKLSDAQRKKNANVQSRLQRQPPAVECLAPGV